MSGIRSVADLEEYLRNSSLTWEQACLPSRELLSAKFSTRIPLFYANLINWQDKNDPLRAMVIPTIDETETHAYELQDPIGDHSHEPVPGLIHRYPNRCLLLLTTHCAVHCRFCFRRDVIGTPLPADIDGIATYLQRHQEIHEIIFTGGDPGTFPPAFLASMIKKLSSLTHIDTWRFHVRSMVVDPTSVTKEWIQQLDLLSDKHKVVVLHINHPREVTAQLAEVVHTLQTKGVAVLSQTVLLKGINDTVETLRALYERITQIGIKPYYLHHLDKAKGTHHFRISIADGKRLYMKLRGHLSGYSIPEYVVDLPGGDGKVPVMWLRPLGAGRYEVENFEGRTIQYSDPLGV